MPFAQEVAISGGLVIRADSNVAGLTTAATRIVRRVAPAALIENVMTVSQIKDLSVAPRRLNAQLISLFSSLAVIIAAWESPASWRSRSARARTRSAFA
jgi:hypothetical protein